MAVAAWVGSITGICERIFQAAAQAGHAGAAHDDRAGAILFLQGASDLDHPRERAFAGGSLGHAHVERPFPRKPVHQSHLAQVADVPADRALRDRDDAKGFGPRHRGQDAAFGDAEHRAVGAFPAYMKAGVAVAGDDKGGCAVVALDQPPQRHRHAVDVGLALDPVRSLGERGADDFRAVSEIERLERVLQSSGHGNIGIGIDHEDARAGHVSSLQALQLSHGLQLLA